MYSLSGSTLLTGVAGFLSRAPGALRLFLGPLVDRSPLGRLLVGTELAGMALVAVIPLAVASPTARHPDEFKRVSLMIEGNDAEQPTLIVYVNREDATSLADRIDAFLRKRGRGPNGSDTLVVRTSIGTASS